MHPSRDFRCRMLAASAVSYGIGQPGGITDVPQYPFAGFDSEPVVLVGGPKQIDACLVGTTQDGVVLAFRGTLEFDIKDRRTILDWLNDADAKPDRVPDLDGEVHSGFYESVMHLWDGIVTQVRSQLTALGPNARLHVTGHSKGGAMAPLAAALLHAREQITAQTVTLFAPARCGNGTFKRPYDENFPATTRFEYQNDLVPHLPPSSLLIAALNDLPDIGKDFEHLEAWSYESVGTLQFIDWSDEIVGASFSLRVERTLKLAAAILEDQFATIAEDHSLLASYCPNLCDGSLCKPGGATASAAPPISGGAAPRS